MNTLLRIAVTVCLYVHAHAAYAVFIYNSNAPLRGQENNILCGAASGQMLLEQGGVTKTQTEIWNEIQANKVDPAFCSDPDGLSQTMNEFDVKDKNRWIVLRDTDQDSIIEELMENMVKHDRPAALLVDDRGSLGRLERFHFGHQPLAGRRDSAAGDPERSAARVHGNRSDFDGKRFQGTFLP